MVHQDLAVRHYSSCAGRRRRGGSGGRRGVAAVEFALLAPLLVIVVLGAIDIGQLINVSQTLSNASRMGTRLACRNSTDGGQQVQQAVFDYIAQSFPGRDVSELQSAVQISLQNADGSPLITDLSTVPAGQALCVRITMDFSAVRWMGAIDFWNLQLPEMECYGCRE